MPFFRFFPFSFAGWRSLRRFSFECRSRLFSPKNSQQSMYQWFGLSWVIILFWASCSSGDTKAPAASSTPPTPAGPAFRMSTARAVEEADTRRNWCLAEFSETEVFGADTSRPNRRFFYLRPGVTWLTIGDDIGRANLLLRPLSTGDVEVFTGAHFPRCLSRPEYLQISAEQPHRLQYDNRHYIRFSLELGAEAGATRVTVEFPPEVFFAATALRCPSCGQ